MEILTKMLNTPTIAYIVLIVLFLESIILLSLWRRKSIGLPPKQVISFLGSGAAFALALAVVLSGASSELLALCLALAFLFHCFDIGQRWQGNGRLLPSDAG